MRLRVGNHPPVPPPDSSRRVRSKVPERMTPFHGADSTTTMELIQRLSQGRWRPTSETGQSDLICREPEVGGGKMVKVNEWYDYPENKLASSPLNFQPFFKAKGSSPNHPFFSGANLLLVLRSVTVEPMLNVPSNQCIFKRIEDSPIPTPQTKRCRCFDQSDGQPLTKKFLPCKYS